MKLRSLLGWVVCAWAAASMAAEPRTLSFEDRVRAQEAIERVYYRHQIGTTKLFEEAVPRSVLEAKVRKSLEETAALQLYWKTPVTDLMLERELARMASGTRMPERLTELYAALGNDAFLIKETLARATLVDRLVHNFYDFDPAMHVVERKKAEELHRKLVSGELSGETEQPNRMTTRIAVGEPDPSDPRRLTAEAFRALRAKLPRSVGTVSGIEDSVQALTMTIVLSESVSGLQVARYSIPKIRFDAWWARARRPLEALDSSPIASTRASAVSPLRRLDRVSVPAGCTQFDAWDNSSLDGIPDGRSEHTAVWTGNVMIVWGGINFHTLNTGYRYDPATDTWSAISNIDAPEPRTQHTGTWTGSRMVVWGGIGEASPLPLSSGGRYDPETDTWTAVSGAGAPLGRYRHTAVWTGTRVMVWGGETDYPSTGYLTSTGGLYDPVGDSWVATNMVGAPSARRLHSAVSTGSRVFIWGGEEGSNTGALYDPESGTWTAATTTGAPTPRFNHTAVWTGSRVVIWGGQALGGGSTAYGGRYDPATDTWSPTSTTNVPSPRSGHTAVWTGSQMIVWGGAVYTDRYHRLNSGGRYDPATDRWTATSSTGAPDGRDEHSAVWTGTLMVVWGGIAEGSGSVGGRYDPATDSWTPTFGSGTPLSDTGVPGVWTGNVLVVWNGTDPADPSAGSGGRYDPVTDAWSPMTDVDAPQSRLNHTAVWAAQRFVVWGGGHQVPGQNDLQYPVVGGRYDPIADSWSPTSEENAPPGREQHSAVSTGREMIVYGGVARFPAYNVFGSGARYDVENDSWTAISTDGGPGGRTAHSAVWTGSQMIVWGGALWGGGNGTSSGGRYDPKSDSWLSTALTGAASPRMSHTAIWTGDEMLVFGGFDGSGNLLGVGGRYDPASDTWRPMSWTGSPAPRSFHASVWTGSQMIVWGGFQREPQDRTATLTDTGGRYDPATDRWKATSTANAPTPRYGATAVWSGTQMLVWGGNSGLESRNGGRYGLLDANDCDDDNPCTDDVCDPVLGCVHTNNTAPCETGNFCTTDSCQAGACVNGPPIDCRDGNPCTDDLCDPLIGCRWVYNEKACDDENSCTIDDHCHYGSCRGTPTYGTPCDDGDFCTAPDVCRGYDCRGDPLTCDDGNPCTDDWCSYQDGGCVHVANDENRCDDSDRCTEGAACRGGLCTGEVAVDCTGCPAGSIVRNGVCEKTYDIQTDMLDNLAGYCNYEQFDRYQCNHQDYGFHWRDIGGNTAAVLRVDLRFGSGRVCSSSNASTVRMNNFLVGTFGLREQCVCDPIAWTISFPDVNLAAYVKGGTNTIRIRPGIYSSCEGLSASDALGGHFGQVVVTYQPYDPACRSGTCDPATGSCQYTNLPNGGACSDADPCTTSEHCVAGACVGYLPAECDDHDLCTWDACDPQVGCVHTAVICDAGSVCQTGSCDPLSGCLYENAPAGTDCNDQDTCTGPDQCDGLGNCVGVSFCDDGNPCTYDYADPFNYCSCYYATAYPGAPCDDGNLCTWGDACDAFGTCFSGQPANCDDGDPCTDDSCDSATGGCLHTNNTAPCDDGNACTSNDLCDGAGGCIGGSPLDCDDGNPCTDDSCNPVTGCVHVDNAAPCDDGSACTAGDVCGGGTCRSGAPIVCNDGNACTDDTCNPATGCVFTNNTAPCDDANACTRTDVCSGGACLGTSPIACAALDQCHDAGVCNPSTGTCSNPAKPDGTACSDGSLCTTGDACIGGTCTPAFSGLNEPNPRSTGYYKRLCIGPHSGDELTDTDAVCVSTVAHAFAGISTVADLCAELMPSQPNGDACDRTDDDLMALALNICRARVCTQQGIDSQCGTNGTVGQSLAESDAILSSATRSSETCAQAKCLDEEINTGRALEMNTLTLRREGSGVRLQWRVPYLEDGTGAPSKYHVWRRIRGSMTAFTKIATTAETTYLDGTGGSFEYEVTAVMN